MLEDVTERRALDASSPPPKPRNRRRRTAAEAAPAPPAPRRSSCRSPMPRCSRSWARRWRTGSGNCPARDAAPAPPKPCSRPPPPRRKLQRIPDQVRLPLENRSDAVLVAKDGQLLFANPAAARLFGYETGEDVINDERLAQPLRRARPVPAARRHRRRRRTRIRAGVQMTVIPWLGGPARQFVLTPAEAASPQPPSSARPRPQPSPAAANAALPPRPGAEARRRRAAQGHGRGDPAAPAPGALRGRPGAAGHPRHRRRRHHHARSRRPASTPSAPGRRRSSAIASPMWRESPSSTCWRPRAARRCATISRPCRARASPPSSMTGAR